MQVELRFFATYRSAVGQKTVERDYDAETVGETLRAIEDEWPELAGDLLDDGEIRPQLSVLKNGREVVHMEGTATAIEDGDQLSVFPPVAGGATREKAFRGISQRLAVDYLENLGGERVDDGHVTGDGWSAALSSESVDAAGSITLTEVTIVFDGNDQVVEQVVEDFTRKAMRAGG